jgi:hypothetical protein
MKARNILHVVFDAVAGLLALLLLLSYVVPFVKIGTGTSAEITYLLTMGGTSLSSSTVNVNFFYAILIVVISVLGLFFLVAKKGALLHDFGIAFTMAVSLYGFVLHYAVKQSAASATGTFTHPGETIYFIYAIVSLVLALAVLLDDLFGEKVAATLDAAGQPTTEKRLVELKDLLDKKLISQEEYDAKRKAIIDEK